MKTKNSFFKKNLDKLVVILIIAICTVMAYFNVLEEIEYKLFDGLLGLHKNPETRNELLIVEIDDESTTRLGEWPWSRDVYADQLLRMKELGASTAVFDVEFLSPSHMIVTNDDKNLVARNFENFTNQLENPESNEFIDSYFTLDKTLQSLFKNNDDYFAQAIQFFGNTWLTVNTEDIQAEVQDEEFEKKYILYKNVVDNDNLIGKDNIKNFEELNKSPGFYPAMLKFISHSAGAGFTNVHIDKDGSRRRVELFNKKDDGYIGQLAFAPLLNYFDVQQVVRDKNYLLLQGVKEKDSDERYDIKIPLDKQGRLIINWKHDSFFEAKDFRHVEIGFLNELDFAESYIVDDLYALASYFYFDNDEFMELSFAQDVLNLRQEYSDILEFRQYLLNKCIGYSVDKIAIDGGLPEEECEEYFAVRKDFYERLGELINSNSFDEYTEWLYFALDNDEFYKQIEEIRPWYEQLQNKYEYYMELFADQSKTFKDSFCLIGQTTSSSTDLGTTPFDKLYPNIGTHANVYNTIMTQEFIKPLPWFVGIIIALILALALAFFAGEKKVGPINIAGSIAMVIVISIPVCTMAFSNLYIQMLWPTILVFVSFITIDILHFFRSEKDKSFLKHAFATYLNPKSVNEIIEHPEKLSLGGEQKHLTALFSDIQKFSSFSESVTPEKLVAVLKTYLGNMSDCILDEGGTIDKYEGDAIIAFFGAPAELENAAYSACASAIRMKQAEKLYNEENTKTGFIDRELNTRIGINTGEMVVGNMGTDKKFNYTIMGNDVNLASRLEGVNKAYKSWILTSEATWNEANSGKYKGKIVARRFDRVRVVNIDKPVQLYNILGFRDEMTDVQIKAADVFEEAMKLYLNRQFNEAAAMFTQANQMVPEDESPLVFAARCKEYAVSGVPEKWTGVTTLTSK